MLEKHRRLHGVIIERLHWRQTLRRYDGSGSSTFIYLHLPYIMSSRSAPEAGYTHEMDNFEHEELVQTLLGLRAHVILSGYNSPLYKPLETAGWGRFDKGYFSSLAASGGAAANSQRRAQEDDEGAAKESDNKGTKKGVRIETIWVCPALVDWVSFVGPVYGWVQARE